jgi:CheY-like chemotaxis protein
MLPAVPNEISKLSRTLPGIDLPTALARLSGNQDALLRFLHLFNRTWTGVMDQLRLAMIENNFRRMHLTVHSLRGAAATLSMLEVTAAARELERALYREEAVNFPTAMKALEKALAPVFSGLALLPPEPAPAPRKKSFAATCPLPRILLVDDVPENLELLRYYLEDSPVDLVKAGSGEEALLRFSEGRFDSVLLDMQMPGMSGYATLRELRAIETARKMALTPVIAISAADSADDSRKALDAGCAAYLPRPVEKSDLLAAIFGHDPSEASFLQQERPDEAAQKELFPRVLARLEVCAVELEAAGRKGQFDQAGIIGHSIRGLGMTFALAEAELLGSEIEGASRSRDSGRIAELAGRVRELAERESLRGPPYG